MVTYFNIIVYIIVVISTMKKHESTMKNSRLGSCIQRTLPNPISADSSDDIIFFLFFKFIYLFSLAANYFTIL